MLARLREFSEDTRIALSSEESLKNQLKELQKLRDVWELARKQNPQPESEGTTGESGSQQKLEPRTEEIISQEHTEIVNKMKKIRKKLGMPEPAGDHNKKVIDHLQGDFPNEPPELRQVVEKLSDAAERQRTLSNYQNQPASESRSNFDNVPDNQDEVESSGIGVESEEQEETPLQSKRTVQAKDQEITQESNQQSKPSHPIRDSLESDPDEDDDDLYFDAQEVEDFTEDTLPKKNDEKPTTSKKVSLFGKSKSTTNSQAKSGPQLQHTDQSSKSRTSPVASLFGFFSKNRECELQISDMNDATPTLNSGQSGTYAMPPSSSTLSDAEKNGHYKPIPQPPGTSTGTSTTSASSTTETKNQPGADTSQGNAKKQVKEEPLLKDRSCCYQRIREVSDNGVRNSFAMKGKPLQDQNHRKAHIMNLVMAAFASSGNFQNVFYIKSTDQQIINWTVEAIYHINPDYRGEVKCKINGQVKSFTPTKAFIEEIENDKDLTKTHEELLALDAEHYPEESKEGVSTNPADNSDTKPGFSQSQ